MPEYLTISIIAVIVCYSGIHLLEFTSFLSRVAGVITGAKVTSYTLQQTTFVATRFLFVAMMPLIGFVVDKRIVNESYLLMVHAALLCASVFYLLVLLCAEHIVRYFCGVIYKFQKQGGLLQSLVCPEIKPIALEKLKLKKIFDLLRKEKKNKGLFYGGVIVFCCYSIGVFVSFYAALNFYDYRSSIGQMSGIVNALATVILTFYVEPRISDAIDKDDEGAIDKIYILLLGRLVGVAICAQTLVLLLWLI
nr:DUF2837 family protein [[Pseudomonas] sp. BICA1-14]